MTVMLGIYAMFSLEMIVEGGYLKNLTGATLAAVGNFLHATAHSAKHMLPTRMLSIHQSV